MLNIHNNIIIASGFDNTGGAGILQDFKTANFLGINPYSVVTSIAVQNSHTGYGNFPVSAKAVKQTLKSIFDESKIEFCKIGMVGSITLSRILAYELNQNNVKIILDTPLKTSAGFKLQSKSQILPLLKKSFLITPNKEEFEELGGLQFFVSLKTNFLIKSFNKAEDVLYLYKDGNFTKHSFKSSFIKLKGNVRGTGCALATAITCFLYQGFDLKEAIEEAKILIHNGIKNSKQVGTSFFLNFK